MRLSPEVIEQLIKEPSPGNAPVMRPEHPPQSFTAKPGPAPLVRDRQTPSTDTELAALELAPADRPGSHDDHAAIATAMSANAGGLSIGDQDGLRKWVLLSTGEGQLGWLARARKRKAGMDPVHVALQKPSLIKALLDRRHDGDHGGLEP
jgi:hypothetical protein